MTICISNPLSLSTVWLPFSGGKPSCSGRSRYPTKRCKPTEISSIKTTANARETTYPLMLMKTKDGWYLLIKVYTSRTAKNGVDCITHLTMSRLIRSLILLPLAKRKPLMIMTTKSAMASSIRPALTSRSPCSDITVSAPLRNINSPMTNRAVASVTRIYSDRKVRVEVTERGISVFLKYRISAVEVGVWDLPYIRCERHKSERRTGTKLTVSRSSFTRNASAVSSIWSCAEEPMMWIMDKKGRIAHVRVVSKPWNLSINKMENMRSMQAASSTKARVLTASIIDRGESRRPA